MSSSNKGLDEQNEDFLRRIAEGDTSAFKKLFFDYYYDLCAVAVKVTKSSELARDVVQEVFSRIWRMREDLPLAGSLEAYLYKSVWNQALNTWKKRKSRQRIRQEFAEDTDMYFEDPEADTYTEERREVVKQVWLIVKAMPEQRNMVFTLYRQHGLSYKEIATVMDISRKTVENHMGLALKQIRDEIDLDDISIL